MNKETYHLIIPPSTGQIYGMIHAGSMSLKIAVAELVANAIDQDAKNININLDKKKRLFIIDDDGNGCAKLQKMVEIGTHVSSKENTIGKYGVGFKDAVTWLGDFVTIDSKIKSGKKQSVIADWQNMMAIHHWDFAFVDDSARDTPGVTITVSDLRGRRFKSWNDVPKYIAELFSAAIDMGIRIMVDGVAVKSSPQPLLTDLVNFKGSFSGLQFEGFAGILVDKKTTPSGWEIRYGPQTVQLGYLKEGFGTYSPQGFYGRFHMINGERKWTISRNKTDSEDLYDVLNCEYMQSVIRPILERIKSEAELVKVRLNQVKAEICLTNLLQKAKVRITEEEEDCSDSGGGGGGDSSKGQKQQPDSKGNKKRKRRIGDPLGSVKDKIKKAQVLKIWPHQDIKNKGFCYLNVSERETVLAIYIDESTRMGQLAWANHPTLIQYAVMCLAVYFGLKVDILGQLQLPIGDLGAANEIKISKALLYLLDNIDLDESGNTIIAA